MENYIIAIDMGTSQTKMVAGLCNESESFGLEILSMEYNTSKGVRRGAVSNVEEAAKIIADLIIAADRKLATRTKKGAQIERRICVNVAGLNFITLLYKESLRLNNASVNSAVLERLRQKAETSRQSVADEEEASIIRTSPVAYSIDNEPDTLEVNGRQGGILDGKFLVTLAPQKYLGTLSQAFPLQSKPNYYFTTLASKSQVLLTPQMRKDGVALVDLGAGTTGLAVYYRETLRYEVSIPIGSDTITKDIAKRFEVNEVAAEHIKKRIGITTGAEAKQSYDIELPDGSSITLYGALLAFVIKARLEEIGAYIGMCLTEARKRGCRNVNKLLLTGGGAQLIGIEAALGDITNCTVLSNTPYIKGIEETDVVRYSAAIGMASLVARESIQQRRAAGQLDFGSDDEYDEQSATPATKPLRATGTEAKTSGGVKPTPGSRSSRPVKGQAEASQAQTENQTTDNQDLPVSEQPIAQAPLAPETPPPARNKPAKKDNIFSRSFKKAHNLIDDFFTDDFDANNK